MFKAVILSFVTPVSYSFLALSTTKLSKALDIIFREKVFTLFVNGFK